MLTVTDRLTKNIAKIPGQNHLDGKTVVTNAHIAAIRLLLGSTKGNHHRQVVIEIARAALDIIRLSHWFLPGCHVVDSSGRILVPVLSAIGESTVPIATAFLNMSIHDPICLKELLCYAPPCCFV
jgi:hypothetical protein